MIRAPAPLTCVIVLAGCAPGLAPEPWPTPSPIVLQVLKHEEALFDWHPGFTLNVPSFDRRNRPYIRSRASDMNATGFVHTLRRGTWVELDFLERLKAAYPGFARTIRAAGWISSRIVFDCDDHAYTPLRIQVDGKPKNLLLHSRDRCRTWQIAELPEGTFSVEHWTGHNEIAGPPPIALLTKHADHPARWASRMTLKLLFPRKTRAGIELGEPVLVTHDCFGMAQHSGGASFAATRDGKTHIVWAEVTDEKVPGAPTVVATYDHAAGKLGEKVFLAHAPPINDVHNTPGICLDREGFLHVVTGAHGANFYYLRSKQPNDAYGGWTKPVPTLATGWREKDGTERGRQTYLAMVCDPHDTLHIAFRQWRKGVDPYHKGGYYAALSTQRKPKGQPWEDARPLVVSPLPGYSIFYHKFGMDHRGRLYLSYSYYSFTEPYKGRPGRYDFRSVLCSRDGGESWHLATTGDFAR